MAYLSILDFLGRIDRQVRVGGVVVGTIDAHVRNAGHARVFPECLLEGRLVGVAGVVAADDNAERGFGRTAHLGTHGSGDGSKVLKRWAIVVDDSAEGEH